MNITTPELNEGEIYVGAIIAGDTSHHIILLPGDHDSINWHGGMEWASSLGGDLPNRVEQSMLYAQQRDHLKSEWYWSNQQHEADASYAWYQSFGDGYQDFNHKNEPCRCRAVRRVAI